MPLDVPLDVRAGADTDGDGRADTLLTDDGDDLLVLTDLDADGLADRVLRIGPDGSVDRYPEADDLRDDPGFGFLGRLLGPDPGNVGGPG